MLRVKLRNLELLLSSEVHHEDVEGIRAWQLAVLDLPGHGLNQILEVLIVVLPITARQLGVHEGHECVRLVDVQGERLFVVLERLIELAFELEDVAEARNRA